MKIITIAALFTACLIAAPAAASTVGVIDVDAAYGRRLAADPYLDQTLVRLAHNGGIRVLALPVADDGTLSTSQVDLIGPTVGAAIRPGLRRLSARETLNGTLQLVGNQLGYDFTITRISAFVDGYTRPSDGQEAIGHVFGQAEVDPDAHGPAFTQEYDAPGGRRMLLGVFRR